MYFTNEDLILILLILSILLPIFLAISYTTYKVFKLRRLTFALFAARDEMIKCVATGAIKSDSRVFKFYYQNVNSLIQATNTDFFSFRQFMDRLRKFEKNEKLREGSKRLLSELTKQKPEFRKAVLLMIIAAQDIMLEKNFLLKFIVHIGVNSRRLKKYVGKISFFSEDKLRNKANYDEYRTLQAMRMRLAA